MAHKTMQGTLIFVSADRVHPQGSHSGASCKAAVPPAAHRRKCVRNRVLIMTGRRYRGKFTLSYLTTTVRSLQSSNSSRVSIFPPSDTCPVCFPSPTPVSPPPSRAPSKQSVLALLFGRTEASLTGRQWVEQCMTVSITTTALFSYPRCMRCQIRSPCTFWISLCDQCSRGLLMFSLVRVVYQAAFIVVHLATALLRICCWEVDRRRLWWF
jgi:hypothetical protein